MKILLIGNYINSQQESMQRFAMLMLRLLSEAGHEVRIIHPKPYFGRLKPGNTGLGKWLGYIDRFILFPPRLIKQARWTDVIHICDHANAMYIPWVGKTPYVITCNDLIAIKSALGKTSEHDTRWSGRMFQRWILNNLVNARYIACISNHTATDLLNITGLSKDRVCVIHMALNYPYKPLLREEAEKHLALLDMQDRLPYFLHVGGNQWYKNRLGVLRIFNLLRKYPEYHQHQLVMAGKPVTQELNEYIEDEHLRAHVIWLSSVTNNDLEALYSCAEALLFPSLYEGFGWPIIEAQACGCPVITSERPPMTEVGGNAAIYINPEDEQDAAQKIQVGLREREKMVESGLKNVLRFSENRMLQGYLDAYNCVLESGN